MAKGKTRMLWRVLFVASVLSPFMFFSSSLRPWTHTSTLTFIGQELMYPFEFVWNSSTQFAINIWHHYVSLTHVANENTELNSKMNILKTQLLDYEEKQVEITRLRQLLGFAQHFQGAHIVAEVIGSRSYPSFKTLRISKGKSDGVKVGMPIVTAEGVIGRVIRTGLKFSDVHLLIDANFNLDVLLQRTRVRGVLKGADSFCILKLNRRAEVRIGDTVITSGIIGGFSKGLPVGKVIRISYESDNISQTITVEPWTNFDRIEEVIVLENHDQELQKIIETAGDAWLHKPFEEEQKGG